MKQSILFLTCLFGFVIFAHSQQSAAASDTIKTILENDKMKVIEYSSTPGKDVCGKGRHSHPAHLSIMLTDAQVAVVTADGKSQNFELKAGTAFWSEPDTHVAVNNGNKPVKVYIVELK